MLFFAFSLATALVIGYFGTLTFLERRRSKINVSFAALAWSIALWVVVNQLGSNTALPADFRVQATMLDFSLGPVMAALFSAFCLSLAKVGKRYKYVTPFLVATGLLLAVATLFGHVISARYTDNRIELTYLWLYGAYSVFLVATPFLAALKLIWYVLHTTGEIRSQAKTIAIGLCFGGAVLIVANILPSYLFSTNYDLQRLASNASYASILILIYFAYRAIVSHHLFDIRAAAARAVAYTFSIGLILVIYGAVFAGLSWLIDQFFNSSSSQTVAYIIAAVMIASWFSSIRRYFDRATSKIFFKNRYDPQQFIDDLTGKIARIVGLEPLLDGSTESIRTALKPERTAFIVRLSDEPGDVYIHTLEKRVPDHDELVELEKDLAAVNEPIIMVDSNENLPASLRRRLAHYGIVLLVRLVSGSKQIGYLALGEKKSGDTYNQQDIEVLDIISDELALAIENALRFDQIEKFNETLQEEVDDATRRLRYTNSKLKALDETKDEFISMASHQLRTPLTSVKGYLSMVLDGDAGELSEQQRKLLGQAFSSSQRMNYLITDLLNVSRLRTGKFIIDKAPVYLPDVVEDEVSQLHELARAKNIELIYEKPAEFPMLELDDTKTRQVIMNFIDNALHYTQEGGKVRAELEARPRTIEFRVVDNGMGVPKSEQHKLFSKFFRADNARRTRPDGTGLGLFMAKKVIIAQGGAVILKSQEGKGSTFGFIMPLKNHSQSAQKT